MTRLWRNMTGLALDERAISALEYGLILAVIGGAIMGCVQILGSALTTSYATIGTTLQNLTSNL